MPTGRLEVLPTCGTWLGRDASSGGCYITGFYHVGFDLMTPYADPVSVYAIAAGTVVRRSLDGWGTGNVGLGVRHRKVDGSDFIAVYGHIQSALVEGDPVSAGQVLGRVGPWSGGTHLHFGIHPGPSLPYAGLGLLPNDWWDSTNGFLDPLAFLQTQIPFGAGCGQAPSPPTGLTVNVANRVASFEWTGGATGCPASSFVLEAGTVTGGSNLGSFGLGSLTTFTSPTLGDGSYFVRIRAANAAGLSGPSNEVSFAIDSPPTSLPGAPLSLAATVAGPTVNFTWTAPHSGGVPAGYMLEAGTAAGAANLARIPLAGTPTAFFISGVPNGQYFVRLRALNTAGVGPPSNEVVVVVGGLTRIRRIPLPPAVAYLGSAALSGDGSTVAAVGRNAVSGGVFGVLIHSLPGDQQLTVQVPDIPLIAPKLSRDGRTLAIIGEAVNQFRLYFWTPATGIVRQSPVSAVQFPYGIGDYLPAISADLRFALIDRQGYDEVALLDTATGVASFVARPFNGSNPNGNSDPAGDVSADGRFVVFSSVASNLVPLDTNGRSDVFRFDRALQTRVRVSVGIGGTESNGDSSSGGAISDDGRFAAFVSRATNLVVSDGNALADVFVADTIGGGTVLASAALGGGSANGTSSLVMMNADGRYVTFASLASNLVTDDANARRDVFVFDRVQSTVERISTGAGGAEADGDSSPVAISDDGRFVLIRSAATNLVPADTNGLIDLFLIDRSVTTP